MRIYASGIRCAMFVLPVLVSLLFVAPPIATNAKAFACSNSEGPIFVDLSGLIVDTTADTRPLPWSFVLELSVWIGDSNGMNLTIGSYKDNADPTWTNVTMTYMGTWAVNNSKYTEVYSYYANATTFVLDPDHRLKVWNVEYYAQDSLGRWSISDTVNYSYCALYRTQSSTPTSTSEGMPVNLLAGGVLAGAVVLVLSVAYLRRRL